MKDKIEMDFKILSNTENKDIIDLIKCRSVDVYQISTDLYISMYKNRKSNQ